MEKLVLEVENIIGHRFKNKKLIEQALTHSSFPNAVCYERLEFIGDSALGFSMGNHLFLTYPNIEPGQLSLLRAANVSTEKLARLAIRHGFHRCIRHKAPYLFDKVDEFVEVAGEKDDSISYGGSVKAPKILADIVESIIIKRLMEPIATLDDLEQQPQPVTMLFDLCQKKGKLIDIKHRRKGEKSIARVFVDGEFVASASSEQRDIARLDAAKIALHKLANIMPIGTKILDFFACIDSTFEIKQAKQKLHELCAIKRWPNPVYSVVKDEGSPQDKKYVCSVQITTVDGILQTLGDEKSRLKLAENSAAALLLWALQKSLNSKMKCSDNSDYHQNLQVDIDVKGVIESLKTKVKENGESVEPSGVADGIREGCDGKAEHKERKHKAKREKDDSREELPEMGDGKKAKKAIV
ncbi:ribonuclease 3-like protein 2 [Gastrolobium bilobum]|uniref:ribonuclease 3-like protein 2 n=1 Tax=Gastrolobium bilobum TaxID=150636 RepID=UPI002AB30C7C|nr:ribonuclease 3-like protein 2 [Gastrolobium bilobum]